MGSRLQQIILLILCASTSILSASEITIFPEYEYSVNGYSTVQGVFGVHCNGWQRDMAKDEIRSLNLNAARQPVWPWSQYDKDQKIYLRFSPWAVRHYSKKPGEYDESKEEAFAAWKKWAEQDFKTEFTPAMDKFMQNNKMDMSYQLKLNKEYGITDNISVFMLFYHIDGRVELNPDKIKEYFDIYLSGLKKHTPGTKIKYLQWYNEPNYSDFSGMYDSTAEAVAAYIRIYNTMSDAIAAKHPDIKMIGTCIASSTYFNWNGWSDWVVPFLEKGRNIDLYNYHNYDNGCLNSLNRMSMLQAKAESIRGIRPRAMISECNYRLFDPSKDEIKPRFLWSAEDILTMANHPDKFAMRGHHMLSSSPGEKTGDASLIWVNKERTEFRLNDLYWCYWILAEARGKLVSHDSDDSDLIVFTSSPAANKLVFCVVNPSEFARKVKLNSGLGGQQITQVKSRYGYYEDAQFVKGETKLEPRSAFDLEIKPHSLQTIVWDIGNTNFICSKQLREKEFYAKDTAIKLNKGKQVEISVPELPAANDLVFLQMGVFSDELLDAKKLSFSFNGQKYDILWENTQKQIQDTVIDNWFVNIPIPRSAVTAQNRIEFEKGDAPYKLMYASLVYKGTPSAEHSARLEKRNIEKEKSKIQMSVALAPAYVTGQMDHIYVDVCNGSEKKLKYTVAIDCPKLLQLAATTETSMAFELAPGEAKRIDLPVTPAAVTAQQWAKLQISVKTADHAQLIIKKIPVFPRRTAYYFAVPPKLDGELTEWQKIPSVIFHKNGIIATTRLGWDEKNFYSAVQVTGRKPEPINSINNFWNQDSVEYFFDMGNDKTYLFDGNDSHFFTAPVLRTDGKPCIGRVKITKKGDLWENDGIARAQDCRISSQLTTDGYIIESTIPWEMLAKNFIPRPGNMIGFDIAISPQNYSLFGLDMKYHANPDKWGVVILKKNIDPAEDKSVHIDMARAAQESQVLNLNFAGNFDRSKLLFTNTVTATGKSLDMSASTEKYNGSWVKVKAPLTEKLDDKGIMTKIVLNGFEKEKASRNDDAWLQLFRAFWAPEIPGGNTFVDPYVMTGPLIFLNLEYAENNENIQISLYKKFEKTAGKGNYGTALWTGTVKKKFPLEISLWLSDSAYSIDVSGEAQTSNGVKSALHGYEQFFQDKNLKFAMRNVNGSHWQGKTSLLRLSFSKGNSPVLK